MMIYNLKDEKGNIKAGNESYLCIEKNRDGEVKDIRIDYQAEFFNFQEPIDSSTKQLIPDNDRIHLDIVEYI